MIHYKKKIKTFEVPEYITCDRCKNSYSTDPYTDDSMEVQEFHHIRFTGGFSSVFGDSVPIECDLCQHCLLELIGTFYRVPEFLPFIEGDED